MRNRRDRRQPNKIVVHVTNKTITGLPFVCRLFMWLILKGIMAKAQTLYPVQVCHFLWMGNHFHFILAGNAKYISPFMNYLGGELPKYLKRLCPGMFQKSVWAGRYKEQRIYSAESTLDKIVYLYANPARAGLTRSIMDWPGLNSWKMYRDGSHCFKADWIPSRMISRLYAKVDHYKDGKLVKVLREKSEGKYEFRLTPNAWKSCFEESKSWTAEYIYQRISNRLAEVEQQYEEERAGRAILGRKAIKKQSILKSYTSKPERTRTPFLICDDNELRMKLIESYREFCAECREAWRRWKSGDLTAPFPLGAYRPGMSLIKAWVGF